MIVTFAVLACFLGWIFFIALWLGADVSPDGMPLGPIIAAAIVASGKGRAELRAWGRQLLTLRTSVGWYALSAVAPAAIIVAAVLINHLFNAPLPTATQLAGLTGLIGEFVILLFLVGVGEEAGWTAFAAPRLLYRHSFVNSWIILSAIRVIWHLPFMVTGQLSWTLGVGGNIAFQFLALWIFHKSGGVWLLAAIWHAVLNTTGGMYFFRMIEGDDQARLGLLMTSGYALAAAMLFLFNRQFIQRSPDTDTHGP